MIVFNFTLSSTQLAVLLTFRNAPECRGGAGHAMQEVAHNVATLRRLCRDEYLEWIPGDRDNGRSPSYRLTPKGEMFLRIVEIEVRRTMDWFRDDKSAIPASAMTGAESNVATGKGEIDARGKYRPRKRRA